MGDISHVYGADIDLSASGDFLYVPDETQQHVIKRLLTALGADIWNLTYGAGLGQFVGQPVNLAAIANAVLSQIFQEESVAQLPNPTVTAVQNGTVIVVTITYADATTGQTQILTLPLGS
jgi:phage baseplate assembly protein W